MYALTDRSDTECNCHKTTEAVVAPIINLQVASGLMPFAGLISGVIAGWGIAACTGDDHFIMHITCIMIGMMEGSGNKRD